MTTQTKTSTCPTCGHISTVITEVPRPPPADISELLKCSTCHRFRTFKDPCYHPRRFFLASYLNYLMKSEKDPYLEEIFTAFMNQQLVNIDKACEVIYSCGGKLFGGMVRDFVVPRLDFSKASTEEKKIFYPHEEADFKDMDVWVTSEEQKDQIVGKLQRVGFKVTPLNLQAKVAQYPNFNLFRYTLDFGGVYSYTQIDIVVAEKYPVNDFSVNLLSYDGVNLKAEDPISYEGHEIEIKFTVNGILRHLREKKAVVLPDFCAIWCGRGIPGVRAEDRKARFAKRFTLVEV